MSGPRPNRQSRSVGNLGDILKHAALVEVALMLASIGNGRVRYVDTHTFLLHAPLADEALWNREIARVVDERPAYAGYAQRERDVIARTGRYRCSSGLVLNALGDRRGAVTLGEANGVTRAELREQIAEERLTDVVVVDDAAHALEAGHALRQASGVPGGGDIADDAVLVHVDPFALTSELWASLAPRLDALCSRATHAVVVAYRYTRQGRSAWPAAPVGTIGPVAVIRGGPHEVAAYASTGVAEAVHGIAEMLGWTIAPRT